MVFNGVDNGLLKPNRKHVNRNLIFEIGKYYEIKAGAIYNTRPGFNIRDGGSIPRVGLSKHVKYKTW